MDLIKIRLAVDPERSGFETRRFLAKTHLGSNIRAEVESPP